MEIDISDKVNRWTKYVLLIIMIAIICTAMSVWAWQRNDAYLSLNNAQISGSLVNTVTKVPGTMVEFLVEDGATVEAGTVLAIIQVKISPEQIEQMQKAAETAKIRYNELLTRPAVLPEPYSSGNDSRALDAAGLERLLKTKEKMDNLFSIGAISAVHHNQALADYESAVSAYASAEAARNVPVQNAVTQGNQSELLKIAQLQVKQAEMALETARRNMQAAEIKAPVDGMVYFNDVQAGDELVAGQTVCRVGNLHEVWLEATVTAEQKAAIQLGQFATYTIADYPGQIFKGTVYEIPENEEAERSDEAVPSSEIIVKISLPDDLNIAFNPGMKAAAKISL